MPRTPSGRISRAAGAAEKALEEETERQAMETATIARMRHTGLSEEMAKKDFAGTVLGLLHFDRRISDWEYEVGKRYALTMGAYYSLTGIPFPSAKAQDLFAVHGHMGDESEARSVRAKAASNRVMELEGAMLRCDQGRLVKTKTFEVCVLDLMEARNWTIHTLSFIHRGFDAMRPVLGVDRRAKDAA
jgi:hypothetical protein